MCQSIYICRTAPAWQAIDAALALARGAERSFLHKSAGKSLTIRAFCRAELRRRQGSGAALLCGGAGRRGGGAAGDGGPAGGESQTRLHCGGGVFLPPCRLHTLRCCCCYGCSDLEERTSRRSTAGDGIVVQTGSTRTHCICPAGSGAASAVTSARAWLHRGGAF